MSVCGANEDEGQILKISLVIASTVKRAGALGLIKGMPPSSLEREEDSEVGETANGPKHLPSSK